MEITQETITLIINGVFAFFIIMGFLFGISRGLKKSALRFTFVVSIAVVMYFAAPYISSWLLSFDFSSLLNGLTVQIGGVAHTITTVDDLITTFISSNQALQDFVTANPSFATLIGQLPTIVTNLAVFLLGFWLLKILTWPIYAISAHGYNKRKEDGSKPKKHRFLGGFMGVVQGAVIALVTFMPIAGVSSILNVEGTDGTGGTLLGSFIPQEIADYFPVFEDSLIGQIGGIGDFDNKVFDGLTTITVKNEETGETVTITPRQEAVTGMEIAGDIQLLMDMVQGIQDGTVTEVDWDLLESLVNKVFELNTLELMLQEYAPYLIEELTTGTGEFSFNEEIEALPIADDLRDFLDEFVISLDEANVARFRSDALAIVNIGRALDEHGIVDLFFQIAREEILTEDLGEQALAIFGTDRSISSDIVEALLSSESIKRLMPAGINVALGYIEYMVNEGRAPEDTLSIIERIDATTIDWDTEAVYLTDIMYNLFSFVNSIDPFNLGDADEMDIISSLELSQLGEIVNIVRSTQLFGVVYSSLTEAILEMPQVEDAAGEYVDFEALLNVIQTTDWANEFNTVEQLIDIFILVQENETLTSEQIATTLENLDSDLLELVIDGAVRAVFIEGFEEVIGTYDLEGNWIDFAPEFAWLDDLDLGAISTNADFFAEVVEFALNVSNNGIEELTVTDVDELVAAVQSVNTNLEAEALTQFKGFFNNLIHYAFNKADVANTEEDLSWGQSLDIDDFIDNIDTVGEFFKLALAIDDETVLAYTEQEINTAIAEIAELDNMSPELITVLQGFVDSILAVQDEVVLTIDIATINWATESDILKDAINLYLTYVNEDTFNSTLANTFVTKLSTSYLATQFFDAFITKASTAEGSPAWMSEANITWITENSGLAVEFGELLIWSLDNDIDVGSTEAVRALITEAQVDALQAALDTMSVSGDTVEESAALLEFKSFLQTYITSIDPIV